MSRGDGTVYRETECRSCGTRSKGTPEPTLSPGVVLAYCVGCKRRMPARDVGPAIVVEPGRASGGPLRPGETVEIGPGEEVTPYGYPIPTGVPEPFRSGGEAAFEIVDELPEDEDRIQRAYREWRATPDGLSVVTAIRRRAIELRRRGWDHYGMKALAEVVRFDRALSVGPDAEGYKVNNSHLSRLARDLMAEEPDLAGFFETRELGS